MIVAALEEREDGGRKFDKEVFGVLQFLKPQFYNLIHLTTKTNREQNRLKSTFHCMNKVNNSCLVYI